MGSLGEIVEDITKPWIVGGDFNVILNNLENLRGLLVTQQETMNFSQCINMCPLSEIKFIDSSYTWWNERIQDICIFK